MRIGIASLWHETNTFAMEQNDSMETVHIQGGDVLLPQGYVRNFMGGFVEGANHPEVELVPTLGISFSHGGLIHAKVYERCRSMIIDALREAGPLDGVYFAFHGAMVAEAPYLDAEGKLVQEARRILGHIPMVGTYDFHAIMSDYEVESLVPFPNNTNPHIDGYERGLEAAKCLLQMLDGTIQPVTHRVFVPVIGPNIGQSTWSHIPVEERGLLLHQLNLKREALEETPRVINITILGGYGYGDSPDTGMSVVATTDGDAKLAKQLANELARDLWTQRGELQKVRPIYPIDEGVRMAMKRKETPVLLVDLGDDPGSACPADSPVILESLIRNQASDCALTIRDAEVVKAGITAGVGATITMDVGGEIDQRFYQPLQVTGVVKSIDDGKYVICGPTHGGWGRKVVRETFRETNVGSRIVLRIGNKIDVIFSQRQTGKDRDFFKSAGILLEEKQILVVKSNQAHRASFDPVVASTIELNTPGVSTINYASLPYQYLHRPIWPIDPDMDWAPSE